MTTSTFLEYLDRVDGVEITPEQATTAREIWGTLVVRFGDKLIPPQTICGDDGSFDLSWGFESMTVVVEIEPNGKCLWWVADGAGPQHGYFYAEGDTDVSQHVGDNLAFGLGV